MKKTTTEERLALNRAIFTLDKAAIMLKLIQQHDLPEEADNAIVSQVTIGVHDAITALRDAWAFDVLPCELSAPSDL